MMTFITLLGGWRAAGFAIALVICLATLGWYKAITIPDLRQQASDAIVAESKAKAEVARIMGEMDKCVAANDFQTRELDRLTADLAESEKRAKEARIRAIADAGRLKLELDALETELKNAPRSGAAAPDSLVKFFAGLRKRDSSP